MQSLAGLDVNLSPEIVVHILEVVEFFYKSAVFLSNFESDRPPNYQYDTVPPGKMRKIENETARTFFTGKKISCIF